MSIQFEGSILATCGDKDRAWKSPFGWPRRHIIVYPDRIARYEGKGGKIKGELLFDHHVKCGKLSKVNQLFIERGNVEWLLETCNQTERDAWLQRLLAVLEGADQPGSKRGNDSETNDYVGETTQEERAVELLKTSVGKAATQVSYQDMNSLISKADELE